MAMDAAVGGRMNVVVTLMLVVALWVAPLGRPVRVGLVVGGRPRVRGRVVSIVAGSIAGAALAPIPASIVAVVGWVALRRRRLASAERADAERADSVVEVADLLGVVVGAGGSVAEALALVADRGPESIRPAFLAVLADAEHGLGLVSSLQRAELPSSFRPLLAGLVSAERDGAPLGVVVARLADSARAARAARVRARVQRLPVLLLAPLTLCFLPAVLIGAVVPVVLAHLTVLGL